MTDSSPIYSPAATHGRCPDWLRIRASPHRSFGLIDAQRSSMSREALNDGRRMALYSVIFGFSSPINNLLCEQTEYNSV